MKDRQPLHAGRVHLEPVNGQQNTFDMTMADGATEQGTPLNKATFLKDATAALYGLTNAVPDDVFAWIGRYAEYCWRRRQYSYEINKSFISSSIKVVGTGTTARTVLYADTVEINQATGEPYLVDAQTYVVGDMTSTGLNQFTATIAGKYITSEALETPILYVPSDATHGTSGSYTVYSGSGFWLSADASIKSEEVKSVPLPGEWELLSSTNRSAYPDSGIQDGYEYEYLGVPFENLPTAPKIETGSYVGTGTKGASNPNSLTFGFVPKLVIVTLLGGMKFTSGAFGYDSFIWIFGNTSVKIYNSTTQFALSQNTLSWYSTSSAQEQCNGANSDYFYIAIG